MVQKQVLKISIPLKTAGTQDKSQQLLDEYRIIVTMSNKRNT